MCEHVAPSLHPGSADPKTLLEPEQTDSAQQTEDNSSLHLLQMEIIIAYYFIDIVSSLAFPRMLDRRENLEPCHTNTCHWILDLEKYRSWRSEPRGLLWIKGKPGAGKSTLMAFLHSRLKSVQTDDQGIQLDFFFTARGTELQRTPLGMLRSLVNQMFAQDSKIRPQVRAAYRERRERFGYAESQWSWL